MIHSWSGVFEALLLCSFILLVPILMVAAVVGWRTTDKYFDKKEEENRTHGLDDLGVEKDGPSHPQGVDG